MGRDDGDYCSSREGYCWPHPKVGMAQRDLLRFGRAFFRGREIGLLKSEHGKIVNQFHADGCIGGIEKTKEVGVYLGVLRL